VTGLLGCVSMFSPRVPCGEILGWAGDDVHNLHWHWRECVPPSETISLRLRRIILTQLPRRAAMLPAWWWPSESCRQVANSGSRLQARTDRAASFSGSTTRTLLCRRRRLDALADRQVSGEKGGLKAVRKPLNVPERRE